MISNKSLVENKTLSLINKKIEKLKEDHLYYGSEIIQETIAGLYNKKIKFDKKKLSLTKDEEDFLTFINKLFHIESKEHYSSYGLVKTK